MFKLKDLLCNDCEHEWEDLVDGELPPCPKCNSANTRTTFPKKIGYVKVELNRIEKKQKLKEDSAKLKKEMKSNENLRANVMGEEKYNNEVKMAKEIKDNLRNL